MEKTSQEKYRAELIAKYEQRAFECLALYNYYGKEYSGIEKQVTDMQDKKAEAEKQIREMESVKSSVEIRNKRKALKKDCDQYDKRIESVSGLMKKFYEKTVSYREEGVRCLEQVEDFKAFNLKTPEEIAKSKVEDKSAETKNNDSVQN